MIFDEKIQKYFSIIFSNPNLVCDGLVEQTATAQGQLLFASRFSHLGIASGNGQSTVVWPSLQKIYRNYS